MKILRVWSFSVRAICGVCLQDGKNKGLDVEVWV